MATPYKPEEQLYVIIDYPDTRKRITVTYSNSNDNDDENNENTINLVVSNQIKTFSGLLSILMNRFQIKSTLKSKLRLMTVDGRRVNGLTQIYNNQLLNLSISKLTTSNEFSEEFLGDSSKSTGSKVEKVIDQLELFSSKSGDINTNEFIRDIKKLKFTYPDTVVIGESFPYRCKVIFCSEKYKEIFFMYLVEPESYGGEPFKSYKIASDSTTSSLMKFTNEIDRLQETDILNFISKAYTIYKSISTFTEEPTLDPRTALLFSMKPQTTSTISKFILDSYQKINYLVKYLDSPFSLVRDLLFKSKWNIKMAIFEHDKLKNRNLPGSSQFTNCTHKNKDIHHYKFNGLMETESKTIECSICYCDYDSKKEMIELICGHRFCKDCLSNYFSCSINEGNGNSSSICCPQLGCENKVVDEVTIESCVSQNLSSKLFNNFFNDLVFTGGAKWCPSPSCERIFNPQNKSPKDTLPFVLCSCQIPLCLFCGKQEFHWPLSCSLGKVESKSELENIDWIAKNCTPCPSCKNMVQKNQGCNHMTCSRCRTEFCYVCGANYNGHNCTLMTETKKVDHFIKSYLGKSPAVANYLETKRKSFKDPVATILYGNMMLAIFVKRLGKVSSQIEDFIMSLVRVCTGKEKEDELLLKQTRTNYFRIAMEVAVKSKDPQNQILYPSSLLDRSTASLSAHICLNGSKKILLDNLFVFTQFYQFKLEIVKQLKKIQGLVEMDASKIKIYNGNGAEIKSSQEILLKERLYICSNKSEKFIQPEDYIEPLANEDQEHIELQIDGQKNKKFLILDEKKKRNRSIENLKKQQQIKSNILEKLVIDQNQVIVEDKDLVIEEVVEEEEDISSSSDSEPIEKKVSSIRISSQQEMDIVENEISEMIKEFEDDESHQIEIINSILEAYKDSTLDFEQVYQICYSSKSTDEAFLAMSDYFDEKNHFKNYNVNEKEILIKEKIEALFPGLSNIIIYRAMDQNNSDLEASTAWILAKYSNLLSDFNNNIQFHNMKKGIKKQQNQINNTTVAEKLQRTIQESYNSDAFDEEEFEEYYEEYVEYDDIVDNLPSRRDKNYKNDWY